MRNLKFAYAKNKICICKNEGADQLCSNYLLISKISSFYHFSVTVQTGLCQTRNPEDRFSFVASLIFILMHMNVL